MLQLKVWRVACYAAGKLTMQKIERIRDTLPLPFDEGYFKTRLKEGWRLVAVHWEREVESEQVDQPQ